MPTAQLLGIVALCRVRYVYAADLLSIMLLADDRSETGEDITLRLPCVANHVLREGDPPLLALRLFDPAADGGRTSLAPGPCRDAARAARKAIDQAAAAVCHIPIQPRSQWLDSLTPGVLLTGELYLLPQLPDFPEPDDNAPLNRSRLRLDGVDRLSRKLVQAGHARYPEQHEAHEPPRRAG